MELDAIATPYFLFFIRKNRRVLSGASILESFERTTKVGEVALELELSKSHDTELVNTAQFDLFDLRR